MYVSKVYLGSSVKLIMNVIENILNTVNKKENSTEEYTQKKKKEIQFWNYNSSEILLKSIQIFSLIQPL